jgi:hypothetical protein
MIGTIFARHGLVVRRRRRVAPPNGPLTAAGTANAVWSVDFKGRFRTGDGARCDPLTLLDVHCKIARNFDPTP